MDMQNQTVKKSGMTREIKKCAQYFLDYELDNHHKSLTKKYKHKTKTTKRHKILQKDFDRVGVFMALPPFPISIED